jgi:hypothetical protein
MYFPRKPLPPVTITRLLCQNSFVIFSLATNYTKNPRTFLPRIARIRRRETPNLFATNYTNFH